MLIELGTDRLSRSRKAVQGTVAGLLGLIGTNSISPNIVRAEIASSPPAKTLLVTSMVALSESDPNIYITCGGEDYLDNETVLIIPEEDETLTSESLGIIPGECGNPEEPTKPRVALQPEPQPVSQPTPTTIIFPRYPQIPLPTPNPAITQRPNIKGDQECVRQTSAALDLLKDKLPLEYNFVLVHIGVIECAGGGGASVFALETPPRAIFPRSLREEVIVYAGSLTHEGCHVWQLKRFRDMYPSIWPPPPLPGGEEEECYNVQYQTQKKLDDHPENLKLLREFLKQRFGITIFNP